MKKKQKNEVFLGDIVLIFCRFFGTFLSYIF